MYWSFQNFRSPDYVLISAGGIFTDGDFASMLSELYRLDYWRPRIPLLLDERELEISAAPPQYLIRAAEYFLDQNQSLAYTKIAVLLNSPAAMLIAERFRSAIGIETKAVMKSFVDERKALGWLLV